MARITKLELEQRLAKANEEIVALRLKISILEGEKKLFQPAPKKVGDVVSTYRKADGSYWNKIRIGFNQYAHRPAN